MCGLVETIKLLTISPTNHYILELLSLVDTNLILQVHSEVRIPRAIPFDDKDVHTIRDNSLNTESDTALDRNPFFQWISGIFGITTTEKPPVLLPPESCDECSKKPMKQ